MKRTSKPKLEVVISPSGIELVRLYGTSWSDQEPAVALFGRLAPMLRQIHQFLAPGQRNDRSMAKLN